MTPRSNDGFTLIGLIVVISILAILAAVALPKFADFTASAETAAFDGVEGGFIAAINIVHAKWLADGSSGTTVGIDNGITVTVNAAGFPTLLTGAPTIQDTAAELWAQVMAGALPQGWTGAQDNDGTPAGGTVTYTQTASTNVFSYEAANGKFCRAAVPCP